jgi:ABC-type phosphate/phosphonate transport system permease subunit
VVADSIELHSLNNNWRKREDNQISQVEQREITMYWKKIISLIVIIIWVKLNLKNY